MGKKKHKQKQRKPRKTVYEISITIDEPKTVHLEIQNGSIRVYDDNHIPIKTEHPRVLITRERVSSPVKGDKVILQLPLKTLDGGFIDSTGKYDLIYAVDTNSEKKNNLFFAEGALAKLVSWSQRADGITAELSVDRFLTVYDLREKYKEQKIWLLAIKRIKDEEPDDAHIALVVDCDLGKIEAYNQRTEKIANQEYLPENITMIYASSDNKDTIFNCMIAQCDAIAKKHLKDRIEKVAPHDQL